MEKEVNIILNREGDCINISSDIENDLDSIEMEEISAIIIELISIVNEKIRKDIVSSPIDRESEEIIDVFDKVNKETGDYVGYLIQGILNFIYNKERFIQGKEPEIFSYSLAVYSQKEKSNTKDVYETYHYGNIKDNEKMSASFAFYKDIIDTLLSNNISKRNIKSIFKEGFNIMLYNIYKYIEKSSHELSER